ncbi:MAG: PilN domain-containing protein [Methylosarcina sp.]
MLNLNKTIDLDVKKFLRWWKRELAFLIPSKIKQLVSEKLGLIIVRTIGNQLELTYQFDDHVEPLGRVDRNEAGLAQYKTLVSSDERLAKANVIIRLNRQEGIHKVIVLPEAARENLYQVVSYELSRYTPFKPEQVYFAVKLLNADNEPGQIRAMLILTPREVLDNLYEDIKSMGLSPLSAEYEGAPNDLEEIDDHYNLLPDWLRQETDNIPRLVYSGLAVAILLLCGAVIALPVWFEYQTVNLLREKTSEIEKDAKSIKVLQSEIDQVIGETSALIEMKNSAPPMLEMLNSLSALINNDTWLSYAHYSDGHLQIQGESPTASGLIAVLEDSDLFSNAKFVSPVTQDTTTGLERFQITVDVSKAGGTGEQNKE